MTLSNPILVFSALLTLATALNARVPGTRTAPTAAATGTFSGPVTGSDAPGGIAGVVIDIFDESGRWVTNPSSNASGDYVTPGMPAGTYYAVTFNLSQYLNERYDDQTCVGRCEPGDGTLIEIQAGMDTADIDFALMKGGSISGVVTADPSGVPIENAVIEIYEANGDWRGTGWSDHTGNYITGGGLPTSTTYRALTFAPPPFLNELYDNEPCYAGCDFSQGTAIAVTLGVETSGKNFALSSGGTFSGTVSDGTDGLGEVGIEVHESGGGWAGFTVSSSAIADRGDYTSPGLPEGDYFALTFAPQPHMNELFDDIPCFFCDVTTGTLIHVTTGTDFGDINFVLDKGGSFSGTIRDSKTGDELEGIIVDIFVSDGTWMANPSTNSQGRYTSPGLPAGVYYARTWNTDGYANQLYDSYPCDGCSETLGTPIAVVVAAVTPGIDFALAPGGVVSGTVTETGTGQGIADVHVEIWNAAGQLLDWQATQANGSYATTRALPTGRYFVKTWNDQRYINEVYPNMQCARCDATAGASITIQPGTTTTGIDFVLAPGGSISGTVTLSNPSDTTYPNVQIVDEDGEWIWTQGIESGGGYSIDVGLPSGTYYARTAGGRPYVNEVWNDVPCLSDCNAAEIGDLVTVTAPSTTSGVDFDLDAGVRLSGTVKDAITKAAIDDSVVELFSPAGQRVSGCRVGSAGAFTCWQAIPSGTYYAATQNYAGYIDELYSTPRKICVGGGQFCDVTQGTPIVVNLAPAPGPIDFTLDKGGWFEGSVIDEQARRGLPGTRLVVYDSVGDLTTEITWQQPLSQVANGSYRSCGLPPGTYYALTDDSTNGGYYADELYDDLRCVQSCNALDGTPITLSTGSGTENIDFELSGLTFADGFESGDTSFWTRVQ